MTFFETMAKLLERYSSFFTEGIVNTLIIAAFAVLLGTVFGTLMATLRMCRIPPLRWLAEAYIEFIRGTPLMLQIFAIYFAIPTLTGVNLDRMNATILAFSINYAAYFAEIFRGGIQSIPVGQHEASQVLGMTRGQTFFHIVLPQVMKRVLLPISNEVITLVKDTSLANVIAVAELFRAAKNEASRTASVEPLFVAGLFYLLMNGVVSLVFSYLNRRMAYYKD